MTFKNKFDTLLLIIVLIINDWIGGDTLKKVVIGISILIIIVLAILFINSDKSFKETTTVTDVISFSSVNVEVKGFKTTINSTVFKVGDKLEVEGINKTINKIKFLGTTREEKSSIISNCDDDVNLLDYKSRVDIKQIVDNEVGPSLINVNILPIKLKNQEYDLDISPLEYFEIKYEKTDYEYNTISEFTIMFKSQDKFKVKDVTANYDDKKENLEYKFEDNTITFNSVGSVIYSVVIEYENGDIINYLFA